jgi:nucleotide-binding universal stress UspA family protein
VRKVLVATDRSASADFAVAWAAELAERYEAELLVLQVVAGAAGETERELAAFVAGATEAQARALVVEDADPSAAIVRVGREQRVDTIVVGNVGMSGRREFLLGNVPNRVSHNAPCTVVIVDTSAAVRRR